MNESPGSRLLLDTLARLHLAAAAMGVMVKDIVFDDIASELQAECAVRAAEDFRSWVNDEPPKDYPVHADIVAHLALTGRPHHDRRGHC